jgi:thymidine phosphorylase
MAFYFRTKKLDISTGDPLVVVINTQDAYQYGITKDRNLSLCWRDICLFVSVDFSDSQVAPGEIGMFQEVWSRYSIPANDMATIDIPEPPHSMEGIRRKLRGETLSYEEIYGIIDDIAKRRLSAIETTYFAASSYSPGFNEQEIYDLTKAMAATGDTLDFSDGDPTKKIVDKHSIGGIPAKGVTPVLVPIVASFGLTVPNTSTRSITTPAGTSDMLEVVMPVALTKEQILETVRKENACLVWGGCMELAPADDVLINVERPLHMESYDKFMVSIIAKKLAMKITHLLIDLPYGKGAKVETLEQVQEVKEGFDKLAKKFGIILDVFPRESFGPDGYGVGPLLEIRDVLRIFERSPERPMALEGLIIEMTGRLLELAGAVPRGNGIEQARAKLENGEAADKFWEIAFAQGAVRKVVSTELVPAEYTKTLAAQHGGMISRIGNKEVVQIARSLGAPFIKEAGMYFHKLVGDNVNAGEELVTLYTTSPERIELAMNVLERNSNFIEY